MIMFGLGAAQIDVRYPGVRSIAEIVRLVGRADGAVRTRALGACPGLRRQQAGRTPPPDPPGSRRRLAGPPGRSSSTDRATWPSPTRLALRMAGVTGATQAPQGGHIMLRRAGEPTGLLQETAQTLVTSLIPAPTQADMVEALRLCGERYVAGGDHQQPHGRRQLRDGNGGPPDRRLRGRPAATHLRNDRQTASSSWSTTSAYAPAWATTGLRIGPMKFFSDGSLIGRTAAVFEPFLEDPRPDNLGLEMMPQEDLDACVKQAHDAGFQVAIHAIGDRAIHMVLTAYERALAANPRRRPPAPDRALRHLPPRADRADRQGRVPRRHRSPSSSPSTATASSATWARAVPVDLPVQELARRRGESRLLLRLPSLRLRAPDQRSGRGRRTHRQRRPVRAGGGHHGRRSPSRATRSPGHMRRSRRTTRGQSPQANSPT